MTVRLRLRLCVVAAVLALLACRSVTLRAQRIDPEVVSNSDALREALRELAAHVCSDTAQRFTVLPLQYGYDGEPNGKGRAPTVPLIPEEFLASFRLAATQKCIPAIGSADGPWVALVGLAAREGVGAIYIWWLQHYGVVNGFIRFSVVRTEMRRVDGVWRPIATVFVAGS